MLLWLFWLLLSLVFSSCITYDSHIPVFDSYTVSFFTLVVVLCFLLLLSLAVLDSCTALSFTLTSLSNLVLHCIVFHSFTVLSDSFTVLLGLFTVMSLTLSLALCCLDSLLCCRWFLHCCFGSLLSLTLNFSCTVLFLTLHCAVFDTMLLLTLLLCCLQLLQLCQCVPVSDIVTQWDCLLGTMTVCVFLWHSHAVGLLAAVCVQGGAALWCRKHPVCGREAWCPGQRCAPQSALLHPGWPPAGHWGSGRFWTEGWVPVCHKETGTVHLDFSTPAYPAGLLL